MSKTLRSKLLNLKDNPTILSILMISGLTLGSKVLGFARNLVVLKKFDPIYQDINANADKISGTIITIFIAGALASSVFPICSRLMNQKSDKESSEYFGTILTILVIFLSIVCGLCAIFTPQLLAYISPKTWQDTLSAGLIDQYILISRISILTCFNFGLQGLFGVILNLKKRFFIFALTGIITNIGLIIGGLIGTNNVLGMMLGMIIGGSLSTLLYILEVRKTGFVVFETSGNILAVFLENLNKYKHELINTLKTFGPRLLIIDALLIASLAASIIQNRTGQAFLFELATSVIAVFYIIVSALGSVFFPNISETLHNKTSNTAMFWTQLTKYLINAIWLGLAISIGAILLSPIILGALNLFGKSADPITLLYIQVGAFGLFFQAVKEILSKYMFAKEKVIMPVLISVISSVLQIVYIKIIYDLGLVDTNVIVISSLVLHYMIWSILAVFVIRKDYELETVD